MSRWRAEDLRGEALQSYETWRGLGLSESAALDQVMESGQVEVDGFDRMVGAFRGLGLSESAARVAAVGRDGTEGAARRGFAESAKVSRAGPAGDRFEERLQRLESRHKRLDEAFRRNARGG